MSEPQNLFQLSRTGELQRTIDDQFPLFDLRSAGLPLPGANFVNAAAALNDPAPEYEGKTLKEKKLVSYGNQLTYLYRRALYDENFSIAIHTKTGPALARLVPGHLIGGETENMAGGPLPADVMILGKQPTRGDTAEKRNLTGVVGDILLDALDELGVGTERDEFYVDNIVKWAALDENESTLPMAQQQECAMLLQQTLRLVRPKYLLCLGSVASKWLLGKEYGVNAMTGRAQNLIIQINEPHEPVQYHTIQVMTATHPSMVLRNPEAIPEFQAQLAQFISLTNGAEIGKREKFIDHRNVYKHRELQKIVNEIRNDPDPWRRVISIDGEWEGEYPGNEGAYLRTIQFSTKHGEGINVVLRHQGGEPAFKPSMQHAIDELSRLCKTDADNGWYPRIGGHFLRADLPWLMSVGLDLRDEYAPPEHHDQCKHAGGWDTGLMYHAVNETASYRLTDMSARLTQAPVYDVRLRRHINDYCIQHSLKKEDLEGYGFLPQWILHPEPYDPEWGDNYAQYDPDVTRRIAIRHLQDGGLLDSDWHENKSWEPYWRSHRASLGVLEMEMTGLMVDKERVDQLTTLFMLVYEQLLAAFRQAINWPLFNPNSPPQCVAFLFGDTFAFKRDKATEQVSYIRPRNAATLNLTPVKTTGKRSRLWADVTSRGNQHLYSPSTDKEVLGILGHSQPLAMQLRDLKFIGQVLKGPLRVPDRDALGNWLTDDDNNLMFSKGLAAAAQHDGCVHTHLSQCKETGRGSSARPPLQNISSRREDDYSRIMGHINRDGEFVGDYKHIFTSPYYQAPVRTIFRAPPGFVLVEADYTGAELAVLAWLADDPVMIEHVRRNALPEDHPEHFDIHASRAVKAFQLTCLPTKRGLSDAGLKSLRVAAKNVNFGIPYGRSAGAIARQCKEEGTDVSVADCQRMIDAYFAEYVCVDAFLAGCRSRSQVQRWMAGAFGRFRRFLPTRDPGVVGEQQRASQNFPIQNTVADSIWLAVTNFMTFRRNNPEYQFRLVLQIHDALLFLVPIPQLPMFMDNCLHLCMVDQVPIWPRFLDNQPMTVEQPYYFGIDSKVQLNWGERVTLEQAEKHGINPAYI